MIKQYKSEGSKVRETVGEDSVGHRGPERLGTHLPLGSRYLERIVCSRLVKEAMTWNLFYLHTFCLRLGLRFQTVKLGILRYGILRGGEQLYQLLCTIGEKPGTLRGNEAETRAML